MGRRRDEDVEVIFSANPAVFPLIPIFPQFNIVTESYLGLTYNSQSIVPVK